MTDLRKAAELALEALEFAASEIYNEHNDDVIADAIKALRQALAQPEQEPVAYIFDGDLNWCENISAEDAAKMHKIPLYTAPPSKQKPIAWISEPMVAAVRRANPDWYGKWNAELTCTQMYPHQIPLYTAPPSKPWVSLTDDERVKCYETTGHYQTLRPQDSFAVLSLARAIEAKLKELNHV